MPNPKVVEQRKQEAREKVVEVIDSADPSGVKGEEVREALGVGTPAQYRAQLEDQKDAVLLTALSPCGGSGGLACPPRGTGGESEHEG
jgi:hypothetical protein